eukprot:73775-Prymnesium_polylepis.1
MTVVFGVEVVIKLIALGAIGYFCDRFNTFDCLVVLLSLPEIVLPDDAMDFTVLRLLRMLRLFRSFKLLYRNRHVRNLAKSLIHGTREMASYTLLLGIFIFICALAGMQLFGGKFRDLPEGNPHATYDTFFNAIISTMQLITCSKWNRIAIDASRASGGATAIYFISIVFVGRYVMLQILTAIFIAKLPEKNYLDQYEMTQNRLKEMEEKEAPVRVRTVERQSASNLRGLMRTLQVRQAGGKWIENTEAHKANEERHIISRMASRIVLWSWDRHPSVSFESGVLVCVLLSVVVITLQEGGPDWEPGIDDALTVADITLTALFVVELSLQQLHMGLRVWLSDPWSISAGIQTAVFWTHAAD